MTQRILVENLPMYVNLADFSGAYQTVIGKASASIHEETGIARIEIILIRDHAEMLDHLVEIAELKAIGFAGIMRREALQ